MTNTNFLGNTEQVSTLINLHILRNNESGGMYVETNSEHAALLKVTIFVS